MKGLAGSLGARDLVPLAVALEAAFRERDAIESARRLAVVAEQLRRLTDMLRAKLMVERRAMPRADVPVDEPVDEASGRGDLPEWLSRFRELLEQADLDAKTLWESKRSETIGSLPIPVVQRISMALENFDFETALKLTPRHRVSTPPVALRE